MSYIHNQSLPEGTPLGVYEIKKVLKADIFDITYRAWNHHLKEWVDIQEYFPHDFCKRAADGVGVEFNNNDQEKFKFGLTAFIEQADILVQLEQTHVIPAENILQFNNTAYLIIGNTEGVPLSKLVHSPASFADAELKFILVSTLNALKAVHEKHIVHAGIRPDTIILENNGEPLLTTFAGAKVALAAQTGMLANELAPGYAPPELYDVNHKPLPATDFYALGATLYYCITQSEPTDARTRLADLNNGKADPVAILADSPESPYSPELLQAVDWMLHPDPNERPQTAAEILSFLKSESENSNKGRMAAGRENKAVSKDRLMSTPLWIATLAGLVIAGFWFANQPSDINADKRNNVTAPSFSQDAANTAKDISAVKEEPVVEQVTIEPGQESDSEKTTGRSIIAINKAETETPVKTKVEDKQANVKQITKNTSTSAKQRIQEKPASNASVKDYLAAARKAMKEVRLTTPPGNNAHKYYELVLALDPGNAEAQAGIQKIVDRYAWFIRKSISIGNSGTARRVLQKAESVLPNDPKLRKIREELTSQKNNGQ